MTGRDELPKDPYERASKFNWGNYANREAGNGNGSSPDSGNNDQYATPQPGGINPAYVRAALESTESELAAVSKGSRNHELNKQAYKLAHYHDLAEHDVKAALMRACSANGLLAEDGSDQCNASFDSGWKRGRAETPWKIPEPKRSSSGSGVWIDPPPLDQVVKSKEVSLSPIPFENGFWDSCDSLRLIYETAMRKLTAPWAVLAHCAARALALTCPRIVLPPIIGGPGSLNWFTAITAISGGGKGAASAVARDLVGLRGIPQRNLGSGEGMIGAYQVKPDDIHPEGVRESVMFIGDEIDTIAALGARTGSTTMAVLRSAFSGETLGFSYIAKGRNFHLEAGSYRMTLVLSVQPGRAGALLDDHRGGTPQRFMWFPGIDSRISLNNVELFDYKTELTLPNFIELGRGHHITIPDVARDMIIENRVRTMHGETDVLDGHALFCREKFAYALAVLDGRINMTEQDWELSGIAAAVSDNTRAYVLAQMNDAVDQDAAERGRLMGISAAASDEQKARVVRDRHNRIGRWVMGTLEAAGAAGISNRNLTQKITSRDRPYLQSVLTALVEQGFIERDVENVWRKR